MKIIRYIGYLLVLAFICFSCKIGDAEDKKEGVQLHLNGVLLTCNQFDSITYFPYDISFVFELENNTDKTLLFGSNYDVYGKSSAKIFGKICLIHDQDTIPLHTQGDLVRYPPLSTTTFQARYEESYFNHFSDTTLSQQLGEVLFSLDSTDLEVPNSTKDNFESKSPFEETIKNDFFSRFSVNDFKEEIYNYLKESEFCFFSISQDYPELAESEIVLKEKYSILIPEGLVLEFISDGEQIDYFPR